MKVWGTHTDYYGLCVQKGKFSAVNVQTELRQGVGIPHFRLGDGCTVTGVVIALPAQVQTSLTLHYRGL